MRRIFAPTVLLLDKAPNGERTTTNVWLQRHGYNVQQVESLAEVLDGLIDFTLEVRPSLILLNCAQVSDVCEERLRLLQEITDNEEVPLIALADSTKNFIGDKIPIVENLEAIQPLMNNLLTSSYSKAA